MLAISLSVPQTSEFPLLRITCLNMYPFLIGYFFVGFVLVSGYLSSLCVLNISSLPDVELLKNIFPLCRLMLCPNDGALCLIVAFGIPKCVNE